MLKRKTAERIEMSYGMCIHLRQPMNHILNAGGGTPTGKGYFEEEIWYSCPAVDKLKVTHKAQQEVAMRPSRRRYLGIFLPTLIRARQWHTQDFILGGYKF